MQNQIASALISSAQCKTPRGLGEALNVGRSFPGCQTQIDAKSTSNVHILILNFPLRNYYFSIATKYRFVASLVRIFGVRIASACVNASARETFGKFHTVQIPRDFLIAHH